MSPWVRRGSDIGNIREAGAMSLNAFDDGDWYVTIDADRPCGGRASDLTTAMAAADAAHAAWLLEQLTHATADARVEHLRREMATAYETARCVVNYGPVGRFEPGWAEACAGVEQAARDAARAWAEASGGKP